MRTITISLADLPPIKSPRKIYVKKRKPAPKRECIFGMPASHGMDGNARARLKAYAETWNKAHRESNQHTGPITRTYMKVLYALVDTFANAKTGSCFPSYKALAAKAGCHPDTAFEAVKVLERAGIIRVFMRLTRRAGGPVRRTSNAYVFRDTGPNPEYPDRNLKDKESRTSKPMEPPKVTILDPRRSKVDAVLASFGLARGYV